MKKKLRYVPMAITIVIGVSAFLALQRFDVIQGPWSNTGLSLISRAREASSAEDYMSYYRRGQVFALQGQFDKALADFDTAVRLRPTPQTIEMLGTHATDSRQPETHTLNLVVLLHTARAETLQHMNRPEEALADLDQVLAFDRRKMDIFYKRGMLRLVSGRFEDAVADFDVVLNTRDDPNWHFARAVAKYVQADWIGAIKDFETAARMAPGDESYKIWLAKTYLRANIIMPPETVASIDRNGNARYVIEAFMSDHNPAQFLSGVRAGAAYMDQRRGVVQCETALFMSEWLIIRKKGDGARDLLKDAESNCHPLSIERAVAVAELGRLQSPQP